jgi:alpha-L-rhamnosidase
MKRLTGGLVAAGIVLGLAGMPVATAIAAPPPAIHVGGLKVEHLSDPLGIDQEHPLLGWKLESDVVGAAQSAYEIEVATDAGFTDDVWDSGKISKSTSTDIEYAGDALESQAAYHWRVRVWDLDGQESDWSQAATFETSFINQADFQGDWIGSPNRMPTATLAGSNWIWYPEGSPSSSAPSGTRYLRKDFTIAAGTTVTSAQVQMTADDYFTLYVNGQLAVASPTSGEAWRTIRVTDISSYLHPGTNTLAVSAQNAGAGAAGVVGRVQLETSAGTVNIVTDTSWVAANTLQTGWNTEGFDDSSWLAARIGVAYGSGPWGNSPSAPVPPEPLLRRDFQVDKQVASARVYVAGLGYYKLFINGSRIGNHELDPGFTDYDDTVLYSTYDVTDAISSGGNVVGVSLGRGYFGQLQPDEWVSSVWHDDPKLKLELEITYTDGTTKRVVSGTDWSAADGPTKSDSVWFGETYDARLDKAGWNTPGYDASAWQHALLSRDPGGELRSQLFPAIEVTEDLPVVATTHPSATATVYDFGVPTAGWAKLSLSGPAGSQVTMMYGEKLRANGTVDNDDVFYTVQNYAYTLKGGGAEVYQPSYSYAGFRYFQVTAPAGVTVTAVTGERVHTAVDRVGDFSSSDVLLDKYNEAQADTILNNLHSVPTDTPMYEKRPYTADAFLAADSAIGLFDMQNFYENWMRTHRDDQSPDGTFGNTVPGTVGGKAQTDPVWSSSYVAINWDLYQYYGNTRVLEDNYAGMKAWMDHYEANIASTGGVYTGFSYADWLSPEGANAPEGTKLTATAYLYRGATLMSQIATALGHDDDAAHFQQLATTIYNTFNTVFYDAAAGAYYDNKAAGYRQTSNLLALSFGLVPADLKATVLQNLVTDIGNRGNHLDTGAVGTKELLPVLAENGYADLAYSVATNPTYPGWGYWFGTLGATTMWEEWNANSRSHDHAFLGTVVDWEYQDVAGIQPAAPGYTKVKIQPYPITGLDHAQAHVQSPFGDIVSSWTRDADSYTLDVTIPVGSSADVYVPVRPTDEVTTSPALPDGSGSPVVDGFQKFTVGSGEYQFVAAEALASTAPPVVSGDPVVGATLSTTDGSWTLDGATFAYQWMRDGVAVVDATDSSYQLTSADYGAHLSVVVTASVAGRDDATGESDPVGPVSEDVAPTVAITADPDANSSGWNHSPTAVTVSGSDELSGVTSLEYRIDGGDWMAYTAPFVLGGGVASVDARATDGAGNVSTVASKVVKVDLDAPVSAATVDEEARTVTLRASDAASGVDHLQYDVGDGWVTYTGPVTVGDGLTPVSYRAVDVAGNVETTNSAVVPKAGVELKPSLVTGSAQPATHAYGVPSSISVRVAGLGGSPTGTVSLRDGAVEVGSGTLDPTGRATVQMSGTGLGAGTHSLQIVYSGDAKFATSTDTVTVVVTKVKPTIRARMSKPSGTRTRSLTVKVGPAAYVDGTVTVKLGSRVLKADVLLVDGKATIRLKAPKKKDLHRLTVVYSGGTNTLAATTHSNYRIE